MCTLNAVLLAYPRLPTYWGCLEVSAIMMQGVTYGTKATQTGLTLNFKAEDDQYHFRSRAALSLGRLIKDPFYWRNMTGDFNSERKFGEVPPFTRLHIFTHLAESTMQELKARGMINRK
jgi:hypothetical protein